MGQRQAGNGGEQCARLIAHALAVCQMTGVVIGRGAVDFAGRRAEADVSQKLGHVLHLFGQACGPLGISRLVLQQLGVLLHHRPAARGVDE